MFAAHLGTEPALPPVSAALAGALFVSCLALFACADEHRTPERAGDARVKRDASIDASEHFDLEDGDVDAGERSDDAAARVEDAALDGEQAAARADGAADASRVLGCNEHWRQIASFVEEHRACLADDECVIVGDCSHADFQAVARDAADEAKALVLSDPCPAVDGPTYYARCRQNKCERVKSFLACGSPQATECPTGTSLYREPCSGAATPGFHMGCQTPCGGAGDDASCPSGFTCRAANVNPCPLGSMCSDCATDNWLCLPPLTCQVELSVTFDGRRVVRVHDGEATMMQLWLENRTDQALTLTFDLPCHGPTLDGLETFDVWNACLAGACASPVERTQLTLAAHEKRLWRQTLLEAEQTTCNPTGLQLGPGIVTFALPNVQGATVCGPAVSQLRVGL